MDSLDNSYEWWQYLMMPLFSGLVGLAANMLGVYLLFYPTRYRGYDLWSRRSGDTNDPEKRSSSPFGIIGIEGIIPCKAGTVCGEILDKMLGDLINVKAIFGKVDPVQFGATVFDGALKMAQSIVEEVAIEHVPQLWEGLPEGPREWIIKGSLERELPTLTTNLIIDMQENIYDILDVKAMGVEDVWKNKQILNDIIEETGKEEFQFIQRGGFYFGYFFGLMPMVLWWTAFSVRGWWWLLPIMGFFMGCLTNYVALKLVFHPLEPRTVRFFGGLDDGCGNGFYGCSTFTLHGLILQRQPAAAATFARLASERLIHVPGLWRYMLSQKEFYDKLQKHTVECVERILGGGFAKPLVATTVGGANVYNAMVKGVADKVAQRLPTILPLSYPYTTKALDIEGEVRKALEGLPYHHFERILHPVFEKDEFLLVLLGGVAGALAGVFQVATFLL